MTDTLVHRGPDGEGQWVNPAKITGLGHRRLSILDLSEAGAQPMQYADGRYTITFNGEIYNYLELKSFLQQKGYKFRSESDTEVLLALYDLKREDALQDLDGMFAFAIWDEQAQTLFCARDRFGEKPFFYSQSADDFRFASEIKALIASGIKPARNLKKIFGYLLYTALDVPAENNETFFEDVLQLEPSHYLIVNREGKVVRKRYWDIQLDRHSHLNEADSIKKFTELLSTSVERRLRSDVPVGSSLSGGLDSSGIVMLIDRLKGRDQIQKTFSARFRDFDRDEGRYMNMITDRCHADAHFVFPDAGSAFQNLEKTLYHQEAPIASASILAQYEVMKLARDNRVVVLLDGQGADEIMAGYDIYWHSYFRQLYHENKKALSAVEASYYEFCGKPPAPHDLHFKTQAYFPDLISQLGNMQRKFIPPAATHFMGIHKELVKKYRAEKNPIRKFNSLRKHLYFSAMQKGLADLLRYSDRNAMAHSVEVRLPFLYHEFVEFVFSLPEQFLLKDGWTKYILRESMQPLLPDAITWRKDKIGFEPPQNQWLKSADFVAYQNEAVEFLKKEKIIRQPQPGLAWNYITLYAFYRAFEA